MSAGRVNHCPECRGAKRSLLFVILFGFTQHLIAQPALTFMTPTDGGPGVVVTLKGTNFNGATAVSFGGVAAGSFNVVSDTVITAIVGTGGASGAVVVTSPQGSGSLPGFSFSTTLPVITNVLPYTGPMGSEVTIEGGNFDPSRSNDTVFFGGVKAYVLSATANSIVVTVPSGAVYAPISVTTATGLTAFSHPFIPVFTSGGNVDSTAFGPPASDTTGSYPYTLTAADFDGDGKSDLAAVVVNSNQVAVLRNTSQSGAISFAKPVNFGTGAAPFYIATADFNGDGKPDLAVTNQNANTVSVLRNTSVPGTISFATKLDFATNLLPLNIATADLDGDGKVDMVTVDANADSVSVFRNTTATTDTISFAAKLELWAGGGPTGIALGDLDGDGKPDMVVCDPAYNRCLVFRNTSEPGSISFAAGVIYTTGIYPQSASIADLDGDGKPELIIGNSSGDNLSIFRNLSSPGTISLAAPDTISAGNGPSCISISDINGDGKPDITLADASSNAASVLQNRSTPGNIAFAPFVLFPVGGGPEGIASGDFDGDGRPDMALANYGGSQSTNISVLHNQMGTLQYPGIDSFVPSSAQQGDTVMIYGYHFTGATAVSFGNTAAASFTVVTDSIIMAVVGGGATGLVAVTAPHGTANRGGFRFVYPLPVAPVLIAFSPMSAGAGDTVLITGTGLDSIRTVSFGGVAARSFMAISDTVIVAVLGSGATGDIVGAFDGGADTLAGFRWVAPPPPPPLPPPVLPVFQLLSFTGAPQNGNVLLQWQTADDSSISYYVVQYSSDSVNFDGIGSVKAKGVDSAVYSFTDPAHSTGVNYYRLKIEDTAGGVTFSPIVTVQMGGVPEMLTVFPNPASDVITAIVPPTSGNSMFELVDMAGNIVVNVPVNVGVAQVTIYVRTLNRGVYKLIWSDGVNRSFRSLLIIRR